MAVVAPAADQFEISIFGPGKGEALAVHLGGGDWLTVDSCKDVGTGAHPVLRYFTDINVDVATQVRMVIGTHAHDDHMSGMAILFSAAKEATFVSSSAIHTREFFALVEADADIEAQTGMKVRSEYRGVLEEVQNRGRSSTGLKPLKRALEQLTLWERPSSEASPRARVVALSPSHEAVSRALQYLAEGTAKAGNRKRLSDADPNELAIALWVEVGDLTALLGADILNGPAGCGWEAVLGTHSPDPKASVFKVPHHGSRTSDHQRVWDEMLIGGSLSLLAPYRGGTKPIPDPSEIERILDQSGDAYITASPRMPAPAAKVKKTRAKLLGIASNVREPEGRTGQIRARWDETASAWAVETVAPAQRLALSR